MTVQAPPQNATLADASGQTSQAWAKFFAALARQANTADWQIGDYRTTARTDLGQDWLACDGSTVQRADYPALFALLVPGPQPAATTAFRLPNVPVVDGASPGIPAGTTYVRCL